MPAFIAAILASVFFNISLVLQSIDARESPDALSFRPALVLHLLQRPVWVLGSALGLLAVALETFALTRLPLAFVQPVIAAGVLILPPAARLLLREPLRLDSAAAAAIIVAGILVLGSTVPSSSQTTPTASVLGELLPALLAVGVYLLLRDVRDPRLLCLVAGVAYGGTGIFTKLLAASPDLVRAGFALAALASLGAVGFLAEMSALQRMTPTRAAPVILALTTVIPVVGARLLLGEHWPHAVLTILGLGLTVLPAMWLVARFSHVRSHAT